MSPTLDADFFNADTSQIVVRTDHQVLVSIAQIQEEQLAVLRHILAALTAQTMTTPGEAKESRSSVEIKTSTRGVDVTVKAYVGSDVRAAGDAAVDEYMRVLQGIQDRLNGEQAK